MEKRLIFAALTAAAGLAAATLPAEAGWRGREYCPCHCSPYQGGVCGRDCGPRCDRGPYAAYAGGGGYGGYHGGYSQGGGMHEEFQAFRRQTLTVIELSRARLNNWEIEQRGEVCVCVRGDCTGHYKPSCKFRQ